MNHNLYERVNRLESLIFEDEEIVSHGRVRSPKPNLFSKKIEEIKLAIERGDDLNSTDRYNRTPLQAACAQKEINVELIGYLLDNGADPNITDKKGVPYLTVFAKGCKTDLSLNRKLLELFIEHGVSLKDGEYGDIPVLLWAMYNGIKDGFLLSLIDDSVIRNRTPVNCFDIIGKVVEHYAWGSGNRLNENLYSAIVNKFVALMNSNNKLHDFFNTRSSESSDNIIATEIALKGTTHLFDAIMKYKVWPFYLCQEYGMGCLNEKLFNALYNAAEKVASDPSYYIKYMYGFVIDVIFVAKRIRKPIDFMANAMTPKSLEGQSLETIYDLMQSALRNHSLALLRSLIENGKSRIKKNSSRGQGVNNIIRYVADETPSSWLDEATRLVCKVLNIIPDSDSIIIKRDAWSIGYNLLKSHNKKLISWFVNNGYGKDIANCARNEDEMSLVVKYALDGDESVEKADTILADADKRSRESQRLSMARDLLERDRFVRYISSITDEYPEFLTDKRFYDLAKELSSSSTNARLLVRYIDDYKRNHKNDIVGDIYDM